MLTSVFHPNFDDSAVCIGDFWAASEGLDDLIIRIGRMIAFQEYNVKSPLNGLAAKWAEQNGSLLPIDTRGISPPVDDSPNGRPSELGTITAAYPAAPDSFDLARSGPPDEESGQDSSDPWTNKIVIQA